MDDAPDLPTSPEPTNPFPHSPQSQREIAVFGGPSRSTARMRHQLECPGEAEFLGAPGTNRTCAHGLGNGPGSGFRSTGARAPRPRRRRRHPSRQLLGDQVQCALRRPAKRQGRSRSRLPPPSKSNGVSPISKACSDGASVAVARRRITERDAGPEESELSATR